MIVIIYNLEMIQEYHLLNLSIPWKLLCHLSSPLLWCLVLAPFNLLPSAPQWTTFILKCSDLHTIPLSRMRPKRKSPATFSWPLSWQGSNDNSRKRTLFRINCANNSPATLAVAGTVCVCLFRLDGPRIKARHLYADLYFRAQAHCRCCRCCQRVQFQTMDTDALAENYKSMSAY